MKSAELAPVDGLARTECALPRSRFLASAWRNLREFFLLREAMRRSVAFTSANRDATLSYYDAGKRRLNAAETFRDPGDTPGGLLLYRDAVLCLMRALLIYDANGDVDVVSLDLEEAWRALDRIVGDWAPIAPSEIEGVLETIVSKDPLAIDRLSRPQAIRRVAAFRATLKFLAGRIEPRSPRELKRVALRRQAVAVLLAWGLLAPVGARAIRAPNLALHRPTQSTATVFDTTAAGAVDGQKNGRFGFHTADDDSPQLRIDLQAPKKIVKFKVFGRGDCCFDQSIPLALETSMDGTSFVTVSERTTAFSENDPWIVETYVPVRARFVRLRVKHHGVLVLGEVEVYPQGWN